MNKFMKPENCISDRKVLRHQVLALAIPIICEKMLISLVEYVDTAMVGSLGPNSTAAVACTAPVMWLFHAFIMAIGVGATVSVAQSIGARNFDRARQICGQAFIASIFVGLGVGAVLFLLSGKIPVFVGVEPEIYGLASSYIAILAFGMPLQCISVVFYSVLRGAGDTKTPMRFNIFTNLLNVLGNLLLIFPVRTVTLGTLSFTMWGADMGVAGAALSTTLSRAVSCCVLLFVMTRRKDIPLQLKGLKPEKNILQEILRIGLPAALDRLAINGGLLVYARLVAGLGTITLAAHQLCLTAESICFMPAIGFETAATTLAGQSVGAKQYAEGRRRVAMTVELCVYCVTFTAIILFFGCEFILGLMTPSPEVIAEGCKALRTIAAFEIAYGIQAVLSGGLRGVGATKEPFYIGLASMWLLRIPLALFLLNQMNGGIISVWFAMGLDLLLRTVLMWYRFHRGSWEKKLREKERNTAYD